MAGNCGQLKLSCSSESWIRRWLCFVVAVTGLPDPQRDHAVRMVKFARKIVRQMIVVSKRLESSLGPDTGDLLLRVGINSGSVTAGVLRG